MPDAVRAADRITTAVQRRRIRLVLTPTARATDEIRHVRPHRHTAMREMWVTGHTDSALREERVT
ncbi:hypothetical protein [Streptomyces sp. NPDC096013]|uniref:hypothetical protein n=1 Tax=Streptomyces sp. NPDC096013 TaxID=3366069 RepID=UPI003801AD34